MNPSQCSSPAALPTPTKDPSEGTSTTGDQDTLRLPAITLDEIFEAQPSGDHRSEPEGSPAHTKQGEEGKAWDPVQAYLRDARKHKLLTPAEEANLFTKAQSGDQAAREQLITSNLRLVVKIAGEYKGLGLPLLDLVNQGNIGLMNAVDRFDPTKGARLATYAYFWIKKCMIDGLAQQARTIELPVHVISKLSAIKKAETDLHAKLERQPTDNEIAQECKMTPERVRALLEAGYNTSSLDAPLPSNENYDLASTIHDERAIDPGAQLVQKDLYESAMLGLSKLSPRERLIISCRMGLDGKDPETLETVGGHLKLTRERVRQIEAIALKKLRRLVNLDNNA